MFFTWSVDKQCLLQGKKGEGMLATAVLYPNDKVPHASDKHALVAIANEKLTILVALEPTVRIVHRLPRVPEDVARVGALPFLSWRQLQLRDRSVETYRASPRELEIIGSPVLAISRGRAMQLLSVLPPQLLPDGKEDVKNPLQFKTVGEMVLDQQYEIAAIEWLSGQVLAILTDKQEIRIIDPFDMTELECIDAKPVNLVCHELFLNPATGKAESSYHSSVRASTDGLLLVGLNQVVEARVLAWSDRVMLLTEKSLWIEALALALDFFEGTAKVAIGLPREQKALKAALSDRMVELLVNYVDSQLKVSTEVGGGGGAAGSGGSSSGGGRFASAETHMLRVAGYVAIDYCITIRRTDILFADIYSKFKRAGPDGQSVFLELLEPYILNDRLSTLSPETMKEFVQHYHSRNRLQQVEQVILHMDIMVLDFHQIVTLCQQHCLFTAMFYVYNRGGVFGVPIEEILAFLLDPKTAVTLDPLAAQRYGYKLFLYLQYCVTGRSWPTGVNFENYDLIPSVKAQVLSTLFTQKPPVKRTRPEWRSDYPFLRYVLGLNTREFFKLLSYIFDAQDWTIYLEPLPGDATASLGQADTTAPPGGAVPPPAGATTAPAGTDTKSDAKSTTATTVASPPQPTPPRRKRDSTITNVPSQQQMLNILVSLMVGEHKDGASGAEGDSYFKPTARSGAKTTRESASPASSLLSTIGATFTHEQELELYKFAAKYLGSGLVTGSAELLNRIYGQMLAPPNPGLGLSAAEVKVEAAERQQALLRLLEQSRNSDFDVEGLTVLAIKAQFFDVQVLLYKKQNDHTRVVEAYIKSATQNPARADELFAYIKSVLTDPSLGGSGGSESSSNSVRKAIEVATLQRLPALVKINGLKTARLVVECFGASQNDKVVDALTEFPQLQFDYLKSIMESRMNRGGGANANANDAKPKKKLADLVDADGKPVKSSSAEPSMSELLAASGWELTPKMEEQYIRLLCRFSPKDVYFYLTTHQNYKIDPILKLCQEYKINDASAYLLERTGDNHGALELILATLEQRMDELKRLIRDTWNTPNQFKLDVSALSGGSSAASPDPSGAGGGGRRVGGQCKEYSDVEQIVGMATLLCQRSVESEKLWFAVLDKFIHLQRKVKHEQIQQQRIAAQAQAVIADGAKPNASSAAKKAAAGALASGTANSYNPQIAKLTEEVVYSFVRTVLDTMMGFVPLQSILRKITNEHDEDELSEFRSTIQGMLDTYGYERSILATANRLLMTDMFRSIQLHHMKQARAFTPRQSTCSTCGRSLVAGLYTSGGSGSSAADVSSQLALFDCGHSFHESCLARSHHSCPICSTKSSTSAEAGSAGSAGSGGSGGNGPGLLRSGSYSSSPFKHRRGRINSEVDDEYDTSATGSSSGGGGSIEDMAHASAARDYKSPTSGSGGSGGAPAAVASPSAAADSKAAAAAAAKVKMFDDAKRKEFLSRLQVATKNQQRSEASFSRFTQMLDSFDSKSSGGGSGSRRAALESMPELNLAPTDDEPREKIGTRKPGALPKGAAHAKSIDRDFSVNSKY